MENTINWKAYYTDELNRAEENIEIYNGMVEYANTSIKSAKAIMACAWDKEAYNRARKDLKDATKARARYYYQRNKARTQADKCRRQLENLL